MAPRPLPGAARHPRERTAHPLAIATSGERSPTWWVPLGWMVTGRRTAPRGCTSRSSGAARRA